MSGMFDISIFNNNISLWDVSNVEDMACMFYKSEFDCDISKWNVSKVIDMHNMFAGSKFNQDISSWNIHNVVYYNDFDLYCNLNSLTKPKFYKLYI